MKLKESTEESSGDSTYTKYFVAAVISAVILLGSAIAIQKISGSFDSAKSYFRWEVVLPFSVLTSLVTLLNARIWFRVNRFANSHKSYKNSLIDTGLVSLGKYAPGKIWGVIVRGRAEGRVGKISGEKIFLSVFELIYSLVAGCVVASNFLIISILNLTLAQSILYFLVVNIVLAKLLEKIWNIVLSEKFSKSSTLSINFYAHFELLASHVILWVLMAMSFLIVVKSSFILSFSDIGATLGGFVVSVIVGWIALVAPAGVGVREVVFAAMNQSIFEWKDAIFFMVVHRVLLTTYDFIIGIGSLVALFLSSRR